MWKVLVIVGVNALIISLNNAQLLGNEGNEGGITLNIQCAAKDNSYWTGYRCACRVGFFENKATGLCQEISVLFPVQEPIIPQCPTNQFWNGRMCTCLDNFSTDSQGNCIPINTCPPNSTLLNGNCSCNTGFTMLNGQCVKVTPTCGENMQLQGTACVCISGYVMSNGTCVKANQCPDNSVIQADGTCKCNSGYIQLEGGLCSRCQDGAFWDGSSCVFLCGINEEYQVELQKCVCKEGYGYINDKCAICEGTYFLKDGYCAQCPINSQYSPATLTCECKQGFHRDAGICKRKCADNEVYVSGDCRCFDGLGRVNGVCGVCPGGSTPNSVTQQCSGCSDNQQLSGGVCECVSGYGKASDGECIRCEDMNLIYFDGICGSCPVGKTWNGQSCICPEGTNEVNGVCEQKCLSNQLVDSSGQCYYCPINEIALNGECQCASGYSRGESGRCQILCAGGNQLINGICGSCSLNSVYSVELDACVCPQQHYRTSTGYCQQYTPTPVSCQEGEYNDGENGCVSCPVGCASCDDNGVCKSCQGVGYVVRGGSCVPECGDGRIIYGSQECDDGNVANGDGCSSACSLEDNYLCNGVPSVCRQIAPEPSPSTCGDGKVEGSETCDDANTVDNDGCSRSCERETGFSCEGSPSVCTQQTRGFTLVNQPLTNPTNVYVTITTGDNTFIFNSQNEMRNFIQYDFPDFAFPTSAYCNQRIPATEKKYFDCLFLYPFGIPLQEFTITLTYNRDGKSGYIAIPIDASSGVSAMRSLL